MHMAVRQKRWTLAELDRMPDDGNRYEVVRGELFVTPAPSVEHELLALALRDRLVPYVAAQSLGRVWHPRSVVLRGDSQVEPDLAVRPAPRAAERTWRQLPLPILVVEVLSPYTARRDQVEKRAYYLDDLRVPTYWIVDGEERTIRMARHDAGDVVATTTLSWHPGGATEPFVLDVAGYFTEALGE